MARRSSGGSRGSAFGRGRPSAQRQAPPPQQSRAVAPQPAAQVAQPTMAAPGGGMMANIASTAAGVAIGHTVGHAITGSLMGGRDSAPVEQQAPQETLQQQPYGGQRQQMQEPCKFELEQFIACAQSQTGDLTLCDGFNQVLKECKLRYGGSSFN